MTEQDKIAKVRELAETVLGNEPVADEPHTKTPIYAIRHADAATEGIRHQIGGLPPGIGAARWPMFDGEPMVHLFTLDLAQVPELKKAFRGAMTLSFFCGSPYDNEAYTPDNEETAVLCTSEEDWVSSSAPDGVELWPERAFELERIEVPDEVFVEDEDDLTDEMKELRAAIYRLSARVLGAPLWLQDPEGDDPMFVLQFDESFVDVNLGDGGIMYVFSGGGFWQCH